MFAFYQTFQILRLSLIFSVNKKFSKPSFLDMCPWKSNCLVLILIIHYFFDSRFFPQYSVYIILIIRVWNEIIFTLNYLGNCEKYSHFPLLYRRSSIASHQITIFFVLPKLLYFIILCLSFGDIYSLLLIYFRFRRNNLCYLLKSHIVKFIYWFEIGISK